MNKKTAIIHDWLVTNAGAEKVLKEIVDIFPDADIFSLVDFLNDKDRLEILKGKNAKTSFIQKLPFSRKYFRNYLPFFPKAIESFDLHGYDLIVSSSWAVAKGIKKNKNQLHISYCHTPIRYAWDLYGEYISNLKQPKKYIVEWTLKYIRRWDIKTLNRVDCFIANSKFVQERIKRIYHKDACVIYPPVDVDRFELYTKKENFYLTASRLVPYKKIDLIVEAFSKMSDKKLVVIGDGTDFNTIKKKAGKNIEILGYQPFETLKDYMQRAKAFVFAAEEDFGIVPVEAQACGTPVIAFGKGGATETVVNWETGLFFKEQTIESLTDAVKKFEKIEEKFDYVKIRKNAERFGKSRFKHEFKKFVGNKIEKFFI